MFSSSHFFIIMIFVHICWIPHHHVKAKSLVGLFYNLLLGLSVHFQLVHPASVKLLETLVTVDSLKLVEIETLTGRGELQCPLGHFLEDLSA